MGLFEYFFLFFFSLSYCLGDKRNTKYERSLDVNITRVVCVHPKNILEQSCLNQTFGQNKKT